MSLAYRNNVTVRLFVGCLVTSELKLLLDNSHAWKQFQILQSQNDDTLQLLRHEGKNYLGWLTESIEISIATIADYEIKLKELMTQYCSSYESEKVNIVVFPQVFVS